MQKPIISFVVTTHSRPALLKRALRSILQSSNSDFEIVLCADEGEAATFQVANSFLRSCDTFLRIPFMKGPSESRNIGARVAKGKRVCFLDDDDTFGENHIDLLLNLASQKYHHVYFFNYSKTLENRTEENAVELNRTSRTIYDQDPQSLLIRNFIPLHALLYPAELFSKYKFDCNLNTLEDWDFLMNLVTDNIEFEGIDSPCENVCVHFDPNEHSRNKTNALDYLSVYRRWPIQDQKIKELRAKLLKKMGINVASEFL